MSEAVAQLRAILHLEAKRGYRNDAVVGGLDEYARQWHLRMAPLVNGRETAQQVAAIVELLSRYPDLAPEARVNAVQTLLTMSEALLPSTEVVRPTRSPRKSTKPASPTPAGAKPMPSPPVTPPHASELAALEAPLTSLPGIGPTLARCLARLGLQRVGDLLWHLPFRYNDYSHLKPIAQVRIGEEVTVQATVRHLDTRKTSGGRTLTTVTLSDASGSIEATFWNPYIHRVLRVGQVYYLSGKVGSYLGKRVLESPELEPAGDDPTHTARIVPVYSLTEGVSARVLRKHIRQVVEAWAPRLPDPLPAALRHRLGFPDLGAALRQVHFPDDLTALNLARRRLAFEELLVIQLGVLRQHRAWQSKRAQPLALDDAQLRAFLEALPFRLTRAQERVLADIRRDLQRPYPMTRLLQGDVGSGKTVIAAAAMWVAVGNDAQAALMAPTEILAEQHFRKLRELFARLLHPRRGWPLRVELLTGSITGKRREEVLAALAAGDVDILIGTHALIQEQVVFHNLAVVVVDEQHRFGVAQRAALREKGFDPVPHTLVMSATPIPRTLALTIYGDMDVSAIDELPPGRQPIKTFWVKPGARERVYRFIADQVQQGRQAFIIYPLVEESERLEDVGAAVAEHQRLQTQVFPQFKVALLHGRLSSKEKDRIMRAFAAGQYHILVSTAVVEVGIDVPNATVILIENAERFGLAQLHQFRGRVGRGPYPSYCILVSDPSSDESSERMRAMEQTQDGFALAEIDLRLRGPGEFFGTRQSGLPDLRLARLSDTRLLEMARSEAEKLLSADPDLQHPDHRLLARRVAEFWSREIDLS
jgi:ATP-dependent DNA helicase RecG